MLHAATELFDATLNIDCQHQHHQASACGQGCTKPSSKLSIQCALTCAAIVHKFTHLDIKLTSDNTVQAEITDKKATTDFA